MGYGSYTAADWNKLKASRGLGSSSNANDTFTNSAILEKYDSRMVNMRESFDSEDSPNSTPIIIGFDVTGSMGYLAQEIATNSLNETIMQILTKKPVSDPHMMCAAVTSLDEPLQVTQFEADIRVVEQLLDFKLGGGNQYGYDNALWYFAAKHTKIDSFEKRGKKGILIGIGDEECGGEKNIMNQYAFQRMFNEEHEVMGFQEVYDMASEKYEIVHIHVGGDRRFTPGAAYDSWKEAMPGRVAKLHETDINCLAEVIVAILQILKGEKKQDVVAAIDEKKVRAVVEKALEDFNV